MMQSPLIESTDELLSTLEVVSHKKGFQNTIVQAKLGGEEVYVKIYGEQDNFAVESLVLDGLKATSIALPRIRAQYKSLFTNILTPVAGRPLSLEDCGNGAFDLLVTTLKELHVSDCLQESPKTQAAVLLDLYLQRISESIHVKQEEKKLACDITKRIGVTLLSVTEQCFVHGDLNASNILYCSHPRKIGFIDFERARLDHPFADLAKFSWRVLGNDVDIVKVMLLKYLRREPTQQEEAIFNAYAALESLGAVSYYAYEGHANNYPYKDQAIFNLSRWPLLK